MKQAILVTAYKNIDKLKILADQFDDDFSFYIHIDQKSQIPQADMEALKNTKNVKLISRKYSIYWGGFNHTKSILHLAQEALKDSKIEYIHLISGQDYPIKSCQEIKNFLSKNRGAEYIESFKLPYEKWSEHGGLDRIDYYRPYEYLNAQAKKDKKILNILLKLQRFFHFKRSRKHLPKDIYGGWLWFTLTYDCMKYVVDYTNDHPKFFQRFNYTALVCEIYFHTIIMNSPFKEKVINDDLRYIVWDGKKPNPEVLQEKDYEQILNSHALFARKIEYPVSQALIDKIDRHRKP